MRLSKNPDFLESVANHPAVFPIVSGAGQKEIRLGAIWKDCIGIEFSDGGFVLHNIAPQVYEAHTLFLPTHRDALAKAKCAASFMFTATDCEELCTKVPIDNDPAASLTEAAGFRLEFVRASAFIRESGPVDVLHYRMRVEDWALSDDACLETGREFHKRLGEHNDHADDDSHDRMVGFAIACCLGGVPSKGVHYYNKWAVFAGYAPVKIVSEDPLKIDVGHAVAVLSGDEYELELKKCP